MKFILFNLVVTGALVFLIADKGGTTVEIPTLDDISARVEAAFDGAPALRDTAQSTDMSIRNTTAPVEAALGDDLAPPSENIAPLPVPTAAPAATPDVAPTLAPAAAPRAEPVRAEPAPEPVGPVELASAIDAPAVAPVPPAPPGLSPDVAKRRAEVLGGAPAPVRSQPRPILNVSEGERAAMAERRARLQDLAEEMEIMAAEASFR